METSIISDYNGFKKIREEYIDLWENSADRTIFNSVDFIESYIKTFEKAKNLQIITLRNNKRLIGLAPLYIQSKGKGFLKWKELRFATEGDYRGFVVRKKIKDADESEEVIIKKLLDRISSISWERICLDYISSNSSLYKYLSKNDFYNPLLQYHIQVPKTDIEKYSGFDEYREMFPKKINKYRNRLMKENPYELVVVDEMTDELLDEMANLHIKEKDYHHSRGNRNRYSLYEDERRKAYIFDLQKKKGNVYHFMLRRKSDNKLICYRNTYIKDSTIHSWNTAYDPEFEKYRVNNTFLYEMFSYIYENQLCSNFSFGSGGYPWKFSFTDDFDVLYKLDYFRNKGKRIEKLINLKKIIK